MVVSHIHFRSLHLYATNLGCCDMVLRAEPSQTLCDLEVKNAQNPSRFESKGSMNAAQTFFFAAILKCLNEHALWTCEDFMSSFDRYVKTM